MVTFLPIIDLDPSDESCIYSTLLFIIAQAKSLHIVPCVTFDQPLWLKATEFIQDANLDVVCQLGGFHTLLSFLGCLGHLLKGSGIEKLFSQVYAEHTVSHTWAAEPGGTRPPGYFQEGTLPRGVKKKSAYFDTFFRCTSV